jgi:hypothetical protein
MPECTNVCTLAKTNVLSSVPICVLRTLKFNTSLVSMYRATAWELLRDSTASEQRAVRKVNEEVGLTAQHEETQRRNGSDEGRKGQLELVGERRIRSSLKNQEP